ncbi:DUF2690 domain-containing protein [Streptomyces sp. NPDC021562]|uniref:DUF2690 domain-containing protein n=1 Tax=Streptomyces sp. NPDC021562 TaxID=3155121 RepID=UPI0033CAF9C1
MGSQEALPGYRKFAQQKKEALRSTPTKQKTLAKQAACSEATVSNIFTAKTAPTEAFARAYARAIGSAPDSEWEEWRSAWENRFQQEGPAVTAAEDQSRGKRFRNPKFLIPSALGTVLLAVAVVLTMSPGKHPSSSCTLTSCRGKEPNDYCKVGVQTVGEQDRPSPGPITVQVRWNSKCEAAWAKAWGDYVKSGDKVTVSVEGGASESMKVKYGHDQHTAMVPRTETQRVRACWERGHDQVCTSWTPA